MTNFKQLGLSSFGPATFAKTELVDVDGDWAADAAVLGVPFDLGVTFRTGTRWGSKAIRDFSVRFSSLAGEEYSGYWNARSGVHRVTNCRIVDCGDIDIVQLMWEDNFKRITAGVRTILDRRPAGGAWRRPLHHLPGDQGVRGHVRSHYRGSLRRAIRLPRQGGRRAVRSRQRHPPGA